MLTLNAYYTGIAKLLNVSAVTSLLSGHITKGSKRPDGELNPSLSLNVRVFELVVEPGIQVMDLTVNVFVDSNKNGTVNLATIASIETQIITVLNVTNWTDGNTRCKSQYFLGSFGPFWDSRAPKEHFIAMSFRSHCVDTS